MVAKLIVHAKTRDEAIKIMARALSEFYIAPIKTTINFQQQILQHPAFLRGTINTHFLENMTKNEHEIIK
jgi:acetyl-CoA carboxylase biotin carboxylase subunit